MLDVCLYVSVNPRQIDLYLITGWIFQIRNISFHEDWLGAAFHLDLHYLPKYLFTEFHNLVRYNSNARYCFDDILCIFSVTRHYRDASGCQGSQEEEKNSR